MKLYKDAYCGRRGLSMAMEKHIGRLPKEQWLMRCMLITVLLALAPLAPAASQAAAAAAGQPSIALPQRQASPLLTNFYDGANRRPLAQSSAGSLNEEDLLLFLLVTGDPHPALYDDYLREADPLRREALAKSLRTKINGFFYRHVMAELDRGPELTAFEQAKVQSMLCPVIELVWLDRVVRPRVEVNAGEMNLYYRSHPEEFITPRRVHVRYIFRPIDDTMSREEADAEEKLMDSLREVLQDNPDSFALAAQQYSRAPNAAAGGEIAPFERGEFFTQFESVALGLTLPGEVSSVFMGPDGLYLIQLLKHIMPRGISLQEARGRVLNSAKRQELTQMARYMLDELRRSRRIESRFFLWDDLRDDAMIARVGDRRITKALFWKLHPEVIGVMGDLSRPDLNRLSKRYIECELMRDDLESHGLLGDPRLVRAAQLARTVLHARRVEDRHLSEKDLPAQAAQAPASADLVGLLTNNIPRLRLYTIEAQVVEPQRLDADTLIARRQAMPQILGQYIAQAMPQQEPAARLGQAPAAVRAVKTMQDDRFAFTWTDLGWVSPSENPLVQAAVQDVGEKEFSRVFSEENRAWAYYVENISGLSPEQREQLDLRMRRLSAERSRQAAVEVFREGVAQTHGVAYVF